MNPAPSMFIEEYATAIGAMVQAELIAQEPVSDDQFDAGKLRPVRPSLLTDAFPLRLG
jgi:hypothetical protein